MKLIARIARPRRLFSSSSDSSRSAAEAAAIAHYKSDTQTLARWLDVGIVKRKGRAFDADTSLIPAARAVDFPPIAAYTLNRVDVLVPNTILQQAREQKDQQETAAFSSESSPLPPSPSTSAIPKLVAFSFKHYGFTLVRTWVDPFLKRFGGGSDALVPVMEVCFVEYGFLTLAKNVFASNLKAQIPASQLDLTAFSFGGVMDFAARLQLPNKYTGYVYLLDGDNKVRWKGCGTAKEEEVQVMLRCAESLLEEARNKGIAKQAELRAAAAAAAAKKRK